MTTLYRLRREPAAQSYDRLIGYLLERESTFGLVWREQFRFDASAESVREDLAPLLVHATRTDRWPGTQLIGHFAKVEIYRCEPAALEVLLRPRSLFAWLQPKYPEDLHFASNAAGLSLITVAHDRDAWIANPKLARGASQVVSLEKEKSKTISLPILGLEA